MFFFPPHAPELNPDEPVWNEIKHRQVGKQPIKSKPDLKKRLFSALKSLQQKADKIRSFFSFPILTMPPFQTQLNILCIDINWKDYNQESQMEYSRTREILRGVQRALAGHRK
jgi:hypothetical protein